MKYFLFLLFLFLSTQWALAGFTRTTINLGLTPKSTPMGLKFIYENKTNTPVVLRLEKRSSESGECKVSEITTHPINFNKSGEVFVNCSFKAIGSKLHQVASVMVYQGKNETPVSLMVKAQVIEQATCSDMDLNLKSVLTKMPVLDQDGMGICYAYTSSQLVEYQLRSRGINRSLSPIDTSFVYKSKMDDEKFILTSGIVKETMDSILEEGVASRECINRVIAKHTKGTSLTSEEFLNLIQKVYVARRKKS